MQGGSACTRPIDWRKPEADSQPIDAVELDLAVVPIVDQNAFRRIPIPGLDPEQHMRESARDHPDLRHEDQLSGRSDPAVCGDRDDAR